jgi:hypothetical protein
VLGPSIVAVVLTFVLADDEAKGLDAALRAEAESRLDLLGPTNFSVRPFVTSSARRFGVSKTKLFAAAEAG